MDMFGFHARSVHISYTLGPVSTIKNPGSDLINQHNIFSLNIIIIDDKYFFPYSLSQKKKDN